MTTYPTTDDTGRTIWACCVSTVGPVCPHRTDPAVNRVNTQEVSTTMSTKYLATINTPGYLPWDDDPPTFDEPRQAWEYLADARREAEDSAFQPGDDTGFSATVNTLESLGDGTLALEEVGDGDGTGVVYGDTPGYDGDHDLGLAYCVTIVEEESADGGVITFTPGEVTYDPSTDEWTRNGEVQ